MTWKSKLLPFSLALLIAGISSLFIYIFQNSFILVLISFFITFSTSFILTITALEFLIFREINEMYGAFEKIKKKDFKITKRRLATLTESPLQQLGNELYEYASKKQQEIDYLVQLEAFRREFIADVSHELKTPIFAAQGFIHTLIDGAVEDAEVRDKFLQKAAKSLDGLDHLIQDLITLSQMQMGAIKMNYQESNLNLILEEVFEQLEEKALEKNIELLVDERTSHECIIWADPFRIKQVLINLIENGIKYGKEGGLVKVWLLKTQENLIIEVEDNGLGIPKKHLTRIFERFYRVEKSRSKEKGGSGLGLAIVKQIVEAHEGRIEVESKVDKGTLFRIFVKKYPQNLEKQLIQP
ncbi:MAG: ATP-binding protein [Thermonemataceae bacterium]|nr:ATP-binding protein [Thermonemataceae bacterium]